MSTFSFQRFAKAKDGVAAVEFALLAPMMIMTVFGGFELVNLLQCNQRLSNTAISLADVVSRDTEVTDAELEGLWPAVAPLMFPDNSVDTNLRITSISIASDGTASVVWSEVCGIQNGGTCGASSFAQLAEGAAVQPEEIPEENSPDSSIIRVEILYEYRPRLGFFHVGDDRDLSVDRGGVTLEHTSFRRSRLVDPIPRA